MRAFLKTLLLYALVGPLVGLLSLVPIAVLVAAWDAIAHWLEVLASRAQSVSCEHQIPPDLDFRCFQRVAPFKFNFHIDVQLQRLDLLVVGAYAIGFIPAVFAGLLVAQAMLLVGNALRFWHVLALGCLVGVIFCTIIGADRYVHDAHFFQGSALMVYVCAFATIVCWLPTRRWWLESTLTAR